MRAETRAERPSRSTAISPRSSRPVKRAVAASSMRSAMAIRATPPSQAARTPCWTIGLPAARLAARSRPPNRRSSSICRGILRIGASGGSKARKRAVHRSRAGPGAARTAAPPRPLGSTARRVAARSASAHMASPRSPSALGVGAGPAMVRRGRVRRGLGRSARSIRLRPADCGAAYAAGPWGRPVERAPPSPPGRRRGRPAPGRRASP